ncbi:hypothetical protein GCM10012280_30500 [Wenjunlia tyrosinilytica]|uniref:Uncharacterized protein n=1 Tax=Wenjunlia tyrosinilytica TaxID=1544741 RepID=A0A917ZQH4_9ACTN|nr:hypothetical protein GCM10012280_30500 [Wenjunlia tyrosinilytica]
MASCTAALACSLTLGDPLMTRETVPRPTPARTATSSSVGLRPRALVCVIPAPLPGPHTANYAMISPPWPK